MDRRELLKRVGVAGGVGVAGLVAGRWTLDGRSGDGPPDARDETPRDRPVRHADAFGTVVDAVAAGADTGGEVPINGFLERNAADDTLLAFPPGTYRLEPVDLSGYTDLGLAAAYETPPTFVAASGYCIGGGESYASFSGMSRFLLDGVEFDFGVRNAGGVVRVAAMGDVTVRNVAVSGSCDDQVALFRLDVVNPDATATVENLGLSNPAEDTSLTGVYVGRKHAGTVIFRDCEVEGLSDNGLYASAPGLPEGQGGVVHVEGGTYRDNNIANVRLGSDGSTARGVTSVSDAPPPTDTAGPDVNVRGIRLRNGRDQHLQDCSVTITRDAGFSYGGLVFHRKNGGATVTDTTVEVDQHATPAIRAFPLDADRPGTLTFENVEVTGAASREHAVRVDGRDGTTIRNCTLGGTGRNRGGVILRDSRDCRIVDSRIDVTGDPLVLRGSTAAVENTTLVTPDGTRHVDALNATDDDFPPS